MNTSSKTVQLRQLFSSIDLTKSICTIVLTVRGDGWEDLSKIFSGNQW